MNVVCWLSFGRSCCMLVVVQCVRVRCASLTGLCCVCLVLWCVAWCVLVIIRCFLFVACCCVLCVVSLCGCLLFVVRCCLWFVG